MSQETLSQPTSSTATVSASEIECPACSSQNTAGSKFCRQCGHLLRAMPLGSEAKKAAPVSSSANEEGEGDLTSPAEIDARRAHQLLDRALSLSERGDLNAALLACRQAVALDPSHAEPYALLGTLLERSGDLRGAAKAYERVVQIAPDNTLERDSLERLKARFDHTPAFNFNADELFAPDELLPSVAPDADLDSDATVTAAPVEVVTPAVSVERDERGIEARLPPTSASFAPVVVPVSLPVEVVSPEVPLVFEFDSAPVNTSPSLSPLATALDGATVAGVGAAIPPSSVPVAPTRAPSVPVAPSGVPKIDRRLEQRRQVNLPVATQRRSHERRVPTTRNSAISPSVWPSPSPRPNVRPGLGTPTTGVIPGAVAPLDFSFNAPASVKTPLWAQMMRGSSFFARTLPLVAVGVLGLGFLTWARSQAVARDASTLTGAPTTIVPGTTTTVVQNPAFPQTVAAPGGVTQPVQNTGGSGFPITNATSAPVAPNANTPASNPGSAPVSNSNRPVPAAPRGGGNVSRPTRPNANVPSFPAPLPPAAVPPAPVNNGGGFVLPPPQTQSGGNAEPPIRVGSLGASGLNPGGSPQEGRIRITQGSISRPAPARSGTLARGNERSATTAAAAGNQDAAINSLTNALNATGADQGFLLQQRAMAFLDRGDSARAVEDFNSSIAAYQDQINRGENVPAAQAGIRSARSGLNLALSRR